ncbi:RNA 3 -terminal phosphate cyclase [Brachionus plicatilis]|uniref:RNA 3'-terminal phosphate cyclase n=1 Tax=Brachionus plicatilis TaxID=10195 RepID=A0A3M7RCK9_BRAPC|nr:RNA 3 -terminal phosphate cyclase [Brachionus plicatilis]
MSLPSIDGSYLEGGGQILRISTALSVLLKKPIKVEKIRAGRKDGGLKPQHLTGIKLLREISDAKLSGAEIKSMEINFNPEKLKSGSFMADTKTAGSVGLLIQSALPCLIFSESECQLHLRGGTNADHSPQIDYFENIFKPIAFRMGIDFDLEVLRRGFYPQGGGEVYVKTKPVIKLKPIELVEFGKVNKINGRAFVAGSLPIKIAERMSETATNLFKSVYPDILANIEVVKERKSIGNGCGIFITAETTSGCFLAGSALGSKGVPAEHVAQEAVDSLVHDLECEACVDQYLQDQLIIFMALAEGKSRIKAGPLTLHTKTAIHFTELLTGTNFNISSVDSKTNIIECNGIGFKIN